MENQEQNCIEAEPGLRVYLRRSARAKRLRLRVLPDGTAEAVLPPCCTLAECAAFIRRNLLWLRQTARRFPRRMPPPQIPAYLDLAYLGGKQTITYQFLPVGWTGAKWLPAEKRILVSGNVLNPDQVRTALEEMLKVNTARCVFPHLEGLAAKFGFTPGKLTVRLQKGRWGSCSARGGAISLNAMLLFLPEDIAEYILIHELCHLRQMNHSQSFWQEVARHCPDYQRRRKVLTVLEKELDFWQK